MIELLLLLRYVAGLLRTTPPYTPPPSHTTPPHSITFLHNWSAVDVESTALLDRPEHRKRTRLFFFPFLHTQHTGAKLVVNMFSPSSVGKIRGIFPLFLPLYSALYTLY